MRILKGIKGFTLVEMIVVVALIPVIIGVAFSILNFGRTVHQRIIDDYILQSSIRNTLEETNRIVRYSNAMFAIPESRFYEGNLDSGWDYFGVSDDKSQIVQYRWDGTQGDHEKRVIVDTQQGLLYNFVFEKINPHDEDSLLRFFIEVSVDGGAFKRMDIESELQAFNSLQIIDYGSGTDPATAIAYRTDDRPESIVGHITMVLDVSGSMNRNLSGSESGPASSRRVYILREEAKRMINEFAQEDNIDISLIPFSTSANNPMPFRNARTQTASLLNDVDSLTAVGGTNTGDGLRRAYWQLRQHNSTLPQGVTASNYTIILVDGVTTFASVEPVSGTPLQYVTHANDVPDSESEYRHRHPDNPTGQIAGIGSALDSRGEAYVDLMGGYLRNNNFSKSFVIGFSAVPAELASVNDIAQATGAYPNRVYIAASGDDLADVFNSIREEIVNDLWHLMGPSF